MKKMTNPKQLLLLITLFLVGSLGVLAQTAPTNPGTAPENTSYSIKTIRALFPDAPVAIANELHGGLHVVESVDELHNVPSTGGLAINNATLQVGMLVWVQDVQMYYRYIGDPTSGTPNVESTTPTNTDANGVSKNHWQALTDILQIPENITVIEDCTNDFYWANGTGANLGIKDEIPANASSANQLFYDGSAAAVLPTRNYSGDHLILMPPSYSTFGQGNQPIATYVYDDDDNNDGTKDDPVWRLIAMGDKAEKMVASDFSLNPRGQNIYDETKYDQGDVIKLFKPQSPGYTGPDTWKVYMLNNEREWMLISSSTGILDASYPIYFKWEDANSSTTAFTPLTATSYISKEDLLASNQTSTSPNGISIVNQDAAQKYLLIEYPAFWEDMEINLMMNGNSFELTNGINSSLRDETIGSRTLIYKTIKIRTGGNTSNGVYLK